MKHEIVETDQEKALRKIREGAAELARWTNTRPLTKEEAEELTRRST